MKINLNGIHINYIEHGSPGGIRSCFFMDFLSATKCGIRRRRHYPTIFAALLTIFAGTAPVMLATDNTSVEFFVDDLIALLDHLHIQQTILCGLSMGGYIALRMYERFPARINGLILSNTKITADSNEAKINRAVTIRAVKQNGVRIFAENFLKSVFWNETFQSNPAAIEFIHDLIVTNSPLGICGTQLALAARTDTTHVLSTIKVPTLIITGDHDVLLRLLKHSS